MLPGESFEVSKAHSSSQLALSVLYLWFRWKLSATALVPCLLVCCQASHPDGHRLILWNCEYQVKCFLCLVHCVFSYFPCRSSEVTALFLKQ